jgi:hypothetical protein
MRRLIHALLAAGAIASSGCATVLSSGNSATNVTGEAWYTEAVGFGGLTWGARVFYCPAPTAAGPQTCKQAKMIALTKEEVDAQKQAEKAAEGK